MTQEEQTQIDVLKQEISKIKESVLAIKKDMESINNSISGLSNRIFTIENNGIKSAVGNMQSSLKIQEIKVSKLEREKKYGRF
ncbi:hypothetical protein [Campylobacter sp. RM16192]|uniref:hypothetical protein n=1 Tax=Campylobacter sp. RM16192 TaxID=1660080 RepID=UPI0014522B7A|nr:hypothetical protein [Campylobacter sp. RM16192]QCD52517.1 hypothetical protein CDOMC_0894 [Campylobacter sp. RM16192]